MRHLFVIAFTCLLAACAQQQPIQLYPGSPLSDHQVLTVVVPYELEVQSINGQHVPAANAMFGTHDKRLHLQPGNYQIQVFYKNVFDIDGGMSHEVVRSRSAVFTIEGQAGELWRLGFERPQNLEQAKALENEFYAWALNTHTGERHASEAGPRNSSLINALLGSTSAVTEQPTVTPLDPMSPAPVATPVQSNSIAPLPSQAAAETLPHSDATLTTLQQLWHLLSPESRAAFLEWASQ